MSEARKLTPAEVKAVLRGIDLFEMLLDPILERVMEAGCVESLPAGTVLFDAGGPPDRVHVVLAGAIAVEPPPDRVEAGEPVRTFLPGEAIGGLSLLTGTPRPGRGRVPDHAEVFTLTRDAFEYFVGDNPGYGIQLAKVLARRLESSLGHIRRQEAQKELSGKLAHFDLSSIFQTIVSTNQTGILTLTDPDDRTVAQILIRGGIVERARCGPLDGEEAFYQVVLLGDEVEFRFRTGIDPDPDAVGKVPVRLSAMGLLMEAMRLKDELPGLESRLPPAGKPYSLATSELRWESRRNREIANEVFHHLREPKTIADLGKWVPCSTFRLYEVISTLLETGQIR